MKTLFLVCDKCRAEVEVEPLETFGYRSISCKECSAELVFQNSELHVHDVAESAGGGWPAFRSALQGVGRSSRK